MERLDFRLQELTTRIERAASQDPAASIGSIPVAASAPTLESTPQPKPVFRASEPPPLPLEALQPPVLSPAAPSVPVPSEAPKHVATADSLELQLGTVWLVRISVVVLLTGLVFLGNFAYHNFIGKLGPAGRLILLYLAGGGLCVAGAWLEARRESLRTYSRVLMGGGVAVVYYATYAAHFVQPLRVIDNPLIAGALLLCLAGAIVGLADRKRSEILATFAVLLSYYAGTVNPVASFTLFSDLVLTGVAVMFLVRRQWTTLSFLSLIGAYASFGFWRWFRVSEAGWLPWRTLDRAEFWPGILILTCYWLLFTAGLFLCAKFPPGRRMAFLSLNNGAYFALGTALILGAWPGWYWAFPCGLGIASLALAWVAQRRFRDETMADGAYLAQGLMLLTLGIGVKQTGFQLAFTLGLEGAVLVTCCRPRHEIIYKIGAALVSVAAFYAGAVRIQEQHWLALPVGGLLALLFLYDARWNKRMEQGGDPASPDLDFRPFRALFVGMALALGSQIVVHCVPLEFRYFVLAIATMFFAFAVSLHGLPELAIMGQTYLLWAVISWMTANGGNLPAVPWWNPALLVIGAVSLVHWWQGQPPSLRRLGFLGETLGALGVAALLHHWFGHRIPADRLLVLWPVVAMVMLGYGVFTRTLALKIVGQTFVIIAAIGYFQALTGASHPPYSLAALACIGVLLNGMAMRWAFKNSIWFDGSPAMEPGGIPILEGYRFLAMGMYVMWAFSYLPERWWFAFFSFSALGLFGAGVWSHRPWRLRRCAVLLLLAIWVFWTDESGEASWQNTMAILTLLTVFHAAKRPALNWPGLTTQWRDRIAYALLATLGLLVNRWVEFCGEGFYTTVAWSILAALVLVSGFLLHERSHRRSGMVLLAMSLGRIVLVDVWNLETGSRIASFLVLGLVLSLLGYVYNRFAERIRTIE